MVTLFNLHQKSDDELVLRRPDDDFVLVDEAFFTIDSVEMMKPTQKPVANTDPDYPFETSIDKMPSTRDADRIFKVHAPKLKAGDQFRGRVYMIHWIGNLPTGGPHFVIDPAVDTAP